MGRRWGNFGGAERERNDNPIRGGNEHRVLEHKENPNGEWMKAMKRGPNGALHLHRLHIYHLANKNNLFSPNNEGSRIPGYILYSLRSTAGEKRSSGLNCFTRRLITTSHSGPQRYVCSEALRWNWCMSLEKRLNCRDRYAIRIGKKLKANVKFDMWANQANGYTIHWSHG